MGIGLEVDDGLVSVDFLCGWVIVNIVDVYFWYVDFFVGERLSVGKVVVRFWMD